MIYRPLNPQMKLSDLVKEEKYGIFRHYLFSHMTPDRYNASLASLGYDKGDFSRGLHRLEELAASDGKEGASYRHWVYPDEERLANYDKADVCLLHFPSRDHRQIRPYVLVIPGGGFNRQWGLVEGHCIATALNDMGYTAFVLYYRVKQEPLMPKPIEDMQAAIAYIEANADSFAVKAGHYMIGGFSAGATLAAEIASDNFGYASVPFSLDLGLSGKYDWVPKNIPAPEAIFLAYGAFSPLSIHKQLRDLPQSSPLQVIMSPFLRKLAGPYYNEQILSAFELTQHIDRNYPKTYLVANEDDQTVPVLNTHLLDARLQELDVPHITRIGREGDHSFGLGRGLAVDGWLKEAVDFWQENAHVHN